MKKCKESKLLSKAIEISAKSHSGQLDKCNKPYILHPIRVMNHCREINEKIVAILHEVIEFTDVTLEYLSSYFNNNIIEAIDCLTRRENESREEYLNRVKMNNISLVVKLKDIEDNTTCSRMVGLDDETVSRILIKYKKDMEIIFGKKTDLSNNDGSSIENIYGSITTQLRNDMRKRK